MTNMKRIAALAMAGVLSVTLLAGCQTNGAASSGGDVSAPGLDVKVENISDIGQYLTGLPSDQVVATVNGEISITAGELCHWLIADCDGILSEYAYMGLSELPWDTEIEGTTMSKLLMEDAVYMAAIQRLIEKQAQTENLSVSKEDQEAIDTALDILKEQAKTQQGLELEHFLWQYGMSEQLYRWNCECDYLYMALTQARYGEGTEGYPDDQTVLDYVNETGAYSVKHILLATMDLYTGTTLSEADLLLKENQAKKLLEQLRASEDPIALFDELMTEYSEDPGLVENPHGYIFTPNGNVDPAFEKAALALKEGEISEIVEGESGYHIILRLPLEVDAADYREAYITEKMTQQANQWLEDAKIEYTDAFAKLDAKAIYEAVGALRAKLLPEKTEE